MRAGVVPVPINTLLTADTVGYILADSRAEAVVISARLVGDAAAGAARGPARGSDRVAAGRIGARSGG